MEFKNTTYLLILTKLNTYRILIVRTSQNLKFEFLLIQITKPLLNKYT